MKNGVTTTIALSEDDGARMIVTLTKNELKQLVHDTVVAALAASHRMPTDKEILLTPEQAAALIGVNRRWLYRRAAKLPFTRRISRKTLRFSEGGLRRWIAAGKPDSRR
jgi:hypothetical protein